MAEKLKLSFVNGGKEFVVPKMTVKKHEELLEELSGKDKDITSIKFNRMMNRMLVLKALQEVDEKITVENIENMHPDDYIILFTKIWGKGRELQRDDANFPKS